MLRVDLPGGRSYPVRVEAGGLEGLGAAAAEVLPPGRAVVVTNPVVGALYLAPALDSLRAAGFSPVALEVPDGEANKTVHTWHRLVEDLLDLRVERSTPVFALGGGVTGDVVGFAAATALRGLPCVQVPTTLLAMVDSSVGGKTGVNSPRGKNLVGAFHQPALVYAPLTVLKTLEPAELRCGLGEVVKHGVVADPELFTICEERAPAVRDRDPSVLGELVRRSCVIKADVVAADERESGLRAILNFGHTVGHALETVAGHGVLRHGECVGIGMIAESRWAAARGSCQGEVPRRIEALLTLLGLPTHAPALDLERVLDAASGDKKRARGTLCTAVPRRIGHVELETIDREELRSMFAELVALMEAR